MASLFSFFSFSFFGVWCLVLCFLCVVRMGGVLTKINHHMERIRPTLTHPPFQSISHPSPLSICVHFRHTDLPTVVVYVDPWIPTKPTMQRRGGEKGKTCGSRRNATTRDKKNNQVTMDPMHPSFHGWNAHANQWNKVSPSKWTEGSHGGCTANHHYQPSNEFTTVRRSCFPSLQTTDNHANG